MRIRTRIYICIYIYAYMHARMRACICTCTRHICDRYIYRARAIENRDAYARAHIRINSCPSFGLMSSFRCSNFGLNRTCEACWFWCFNLVFSIRIIQMLQIWLHVHAYGLSLWNINCACSIITLRPMHMHMCIHRKSKFHVTININNALLNKYVCIILINICVYIYEKLKTNTHM